MHIYTPSNSTFDGSITNLLSTLCILIETISRAYAKGKKGPNDFQFGTFIVVFVVVVVVL